MAIIEQKANNDEVKDEMIKFLRKLIVDILEDKVAVVSMNYDVQRYPDMRFMDFSGDWPEPARTKTATKITLEIHEL